MPASVEGQLTTGYVATNTFIHKREIRKKVFPRYDERNLFDWAMYTGRIKESDNTRFNWFELGYLYGYAEIQSSAVPDGTGAGAKVVITLKAASHQESGTKSAGKKWDECLVNGVRGWVASKNDSTPNAHTLTIKPIRSDASIHGGGANALANKFATFFSAAKADGTGMPGSMVRKPDLFYNYTQIIPTQYTVNGSESANKSEFNVGEGEGKPYFYLQGEVDAANKHNLDIHYAFFLGERWDGSLVDEENGDEPVYTTMGIDASIRDFGNPQNYSTFSLTNAFNIEKILSRERAPSEMMWMNGVNLDLAVNEELKDYMDNTGINYSSFGQGDAKQRALDFGFDSFRFSKRTYHKRQEDFLNYVPVTGYTDAPWPNNGYIMPLDRVANPKPMQRDGSDDEVDTICVRYKANDKMSRYVNHWTRDVKITNIDKLEFNHMSEVGLQFAMLNQTVRLYQ